MKKILSYLFAVVSAIMLGAVQVSADNGVPVTGDENWWIYIVLAVVAIAMVIILAVTNKKK